MKPEMHRLHDQLLLVSPVSIQGWVTEIRGPIIQAALSSASVGSIVQISPDNGGQPIEAQIVSCAAGKVSLSALSSISSISPGAAVRISARQNTLHLSKNLLGSVVDACGKILEKRPAGALPCRCPSYTSPSESDPPQALSRKSICRPFQTGIKAIDGMLTVALGSRIAVLARPGVGKSTLLGMIARHSQADVNVIALIGERGREVRDFLDNNLPPDIRARSVCIFSTSDDPPALRIRAASTAMRIAEYFRDLGLTVLLEIDSLTRLTRAYREIGLAAGEIPVRRGYPPSVYSELPRLIERAGHGPKGSITAFYTLLSSADFEDDPMVEEVVSLTDGHFTLCPKLAAAGHYPAISILDSVSRLSRVGGPRLASASAYVRHQLSVLNQQKEALLFGSEPSSELSEALSVEAAINSFLRQDAEQSCSIIETEDALIHLTASSAQNDKASDMRRLEI